MTRPLPSLRHPSSPRYQQREQNQHRRPCLRRSGMALASALMLMLGALILGVSVARTAFGTMASARLEHERSLAHAAAEAALADAEADIAGGALPSSERAAWLAGGSGGFADGCGQGSQDLGLCLPSAAPSAPVWQAVDLADGEGAPVVPYGRYTGAVLGTGGILPVRLPAYLIERLAVAGAGPPAGSFYRITAIGFGTRATTRVVLQALYHKPPANAPPAGSPSVPLPSTAPAADGESDDGESDDDESAAPTGPASPPSSAAMLPAGRIGWRDIVNWSELHARAVQ